MLAKCGGVQGSSLGVGALGGVGRRRGLGGAPGLEPGWVLVSLPWCWPWRTQPGTSAEKAFSDREVGAPRKTGIRDLGWPCPEASTWGENEVSCNPVPPGALGGQAGAMCRAGPSPANLAGEALGHGIAALAVSCHFCLLRGSLRRAWGWRPKGWRAVSTCRELQPPSVTRESKPRAGELKGCF